MPESQHADLSVANHSIILYEWLTGSEFLIRSIAPHARVIKASIYDTFENILPQLSTEKMAFLFHLNCTVTNRFPLARTKIVKALTNHGITVLNESVTDISKKMIQQVCLEMRLNSTLADKQGNADELVIVKTNRNFAGASEWALSCVERRLLGLGTDSSLIYNPYHYMVLPRREVKAEWWEDQSLICERYISNKDNRWYRAYIFLDRLMLCELVSELQIKKVGESRLTQTWALSFSNGGIRNSSAPNYPHQLIKDIVLFIGAFQLDFGTVDVVQDDEGRSYIIDINTTPAYNHPVLGLVEHLQKGGQADHVNRITR
ncbi:MAG: hypothetical protein JW715_16475 [Sedimentisphaerales bacterium]|nr:hypothetical protein [Sedimentisphaerales bacterium]